MKLANDLLHFLIEAATCLDKTLPFLSGFNRVFPTINTGYWPDNVHSSSEVSLNSGAGNLERLFFGESVRHYNDHFCHVFFSSSVDLFRGRSFEDFFCEQLDLLLVLPGFWCAPINEQRIVIAPAAADLDRHLGRLPERFGIDVQFAQESGRVGLVDHRLVRRSIGNRGRSDTLQEISCCPLLITIVRKVFCQLKIHLPSPLVKGVQTAVRVDETGIILWIRRKAFESQTTIIEGLLLLYALVIGFAQSH